MSLTLSLTLPQLIHCSVPVSGYDGGPSTRPRAIAAEAYVPRIKKSAPTHPAHASRTTPTNKTDVPLSSADYGRSLYDMQPQLRSTNHRGSPDDTVDSMDEHRDFYAAAGIQTSTPTRDHKSRMKAFLHGLDAGQHPKGPPAGLPRPRAVPPPTASAVPGSPSVMVTPEFMRQILDSNAEIKQSLQQMFIVNKNNEEKNQEFQRQVVEDNKRITHSLRWQGAGLTALTNEVSGVKSSVTSLSTRQETQDGVVRILANNAQSDSARLTHMEKMVQQLQLQMASPGTPQGGFMGIAGSTPFSSPQNMMIAGPGMVSPQYQANVAPQTTPVHAQLQWAPSGATPFPRQPHNTPYDMVDPNYTSRMPPGAPGPYGSQPSPGLGRQGPTPDDIFSNGVNVAQFEQNGYTELLHAVFVRVEGFARFHCDQPLHSRDSVEAVIRLFKLGAEHMDNRKASTQMLEKVHGRLPIVCGIINRFLTDQVFLDGIMTKMPSQYQAEYTTAWLADITAVQDPSKADAYDVRERLVIERARLAKVQAHLPKFWKWQAQHIDTLTDWLINILAPLIRPANLMKARMNMHQIMSETVKIGVRMRKEEIVIACSLFRHGGRHEVDRIIPRNDELRGVVFDKMENIPWVLMCVMSPFMELKQFHGGKFTWATIQKAEAIMCSRQGNLR